MSTDVKMAFETQRTLAFGSITGTFALIGSALLHPSRSLLFQNLTDVTVDFSDDGVNVKFSLPSNGFWVIDIATNKGEPAGDLQAAQGTRYYAKTSGSPSLGAVNISSIYSVGAL